MKRPSFDQVSAIVDQVLIMVGFLIFFGMFIGVCAEMALRS